ncbi:MAG: hypothetical protein M3R41_09870 [Pseudomonadota bacterium]|nr:hypothetical protein [Pseudomonadota bacterium]
MPAFRLLAAGALVASGLALNACVDDGYGGGVGVGYNSWDPYYGGFRADPYWGWYGDYYYPGTGYYVYDRDHRRHRWNDDQRGHWGGRGQAWHGRQMRPMWRDFRGNGAPQGNPGGAGHGHQRHHGH